MPANSGSRSSKDSKSKKAQGRDGASQGSKGAALNQEQGASLKTPRSSETSRTASASAPKTAVSPRPPLRNPFREHLESQRRLSSEGGPSAGAARSLSEKLPSQKGAAERLARSLQPAASSPSSRSPSRKDQVMSAFQDQTRLAIRDRLAAGTLDPLTAQVSADRNELDALRTASCTSAPDDLRAHPNEEYMELQTARSLGDEFRALSKQQVQWQETAVRIGRRCRSILEEIGAEGSRGSTSVVDPRHQRIEEDIRDILRELNTQCGKSVSDYM